MLYKVTIYTHLIIQLGKLGIRLGNTFYANDPVYLSIFDLMKDQERQIDDLYRSCTWPAALLASEIEEIGREETLTEATHNGR